MSETAGIPIPSVDPKTGDTLIQIIEDRGTGGHFQYKSIEISSDGSIAWFEQTFSFPMPIAVYAAEFYTPDEHDGNEIEFFIGPDTVIGNATADVSVNDTVLTVAQSVIDNTSVGFYLKIDDGVNVNDLGRVLSIDENNLQITVETAAIDAFTAAAPIAYIKQTIKMIPHKSLVAKQIVNIGASKVGGSTIPANTIMLARYNDKVAVAKTFIFDIEYTY